METSNEELTTRLAALEKRVAIIEENQATFVRAVAMAGENDKKLFAAIQGCQIALGISRDMSKGTN